MCPKITMKVNSKALYQVSIMMSWLLKSKKVNSFWQAFQVYGTRLTGASRTPDNSSHKKFLETRSDCVFKTFKKHQSPNKVNNVIWLSEVMLGVQCRDSREDLCAPTCSQGKEAGSQVTSRVDCTAAVTRHWHGDAQDDDSHHRRDKLCGGRSVPLLIQTKDAQHQHAGAHHLTDIQMHRLQCQ